MLCPHHWPDRLKEFSSGGSHKGWNDYQVIVHNTYHGGKIETYHHFICSMPEDISKHFALPNFTAPVSETLKEVIYNFTTTRDKFILNGLGVTKVKYGGVSVIMKTVI